jgi:hypothetical protein
MAMRNSPRNSKISTLIGTDLITEHGAASATTQQRHCSLNASRHQVVQGTSLSPPPGRKDLTRFARLRSSWRKDQESRSPATGPVSSMWPV